MAQLNTDTQTTTKAKIQTIAEEIESLLDAMIKVHKLITEVEAELARHFN